MMDAPTPTFTRYLHAQLKCYSCSHVAGEVAGLVGAPLKRARFHPRGAPEGTWRRLVPGEHLRCSRCEGRLILEEIEYRRVRAGSPLPWQRRATCATPVAPPAQAAS